jgi:hypothetical protein
MSDDEKTGTGPESVGHRTSAVDPEEAKAIDDDTEGQGGQPRKLIDDDTEGQGGQPRKVAYDDDTEGQGGQIKK